MATADKNLIAPEELPSINTLSYNVATSTSELTLNQSISGNIDEQDEQEIFTFTGSDGQVLYYDALQNNLSDDVRVRLVDPSGNTVFIDQEADNDYPDLLDGSESRY